MVVLAFISCLVLLSLTFIGLLCFMVTLGEWVSMLKMSVGSAMGLAVLTIAILIIGG